MTGDNSRDTACKEDKNQVAACICVVIVNYRTADLVVDCLHSIAPQIAHLPGCHVVIVDNASGDGSTEKLRRVIREQNWSAWASAHEQERNGGFAYGNNAGFNKARQSSPAFDYIMLLNPDTLVRPGAIRALADFLSSHPQAGIAGSRLENAEGNTEPSAHNAPSPLGEMESGASLGMLTRILHRHVVTPPALSTPHQCDWVSGASLMIRRALLDTVGDMDEGFFLYYEEVDFCQRARQAGWQVWFVPESQVVHLEGASTGIGNMLRRRPAYWYDSRRRYFVKHFGAAGLMLADALWALGRLSLVIRRLFRLGSGGNKTTPKWYAFDLLWGDLRALITGRLWKS